MKVAFAQQSQSSSAEHTSKQNVVGSGSTPAPMKVRRSEVTRVLEAVRAVALCHNVTPVEDSSR